MLLFVNKGISVICFQANQTVCLMTFRNPVCWLDFFTYQLRTFLESVHFVYFSSSLLCFCYFLLHNSGVFWQLKQTHCAYKTFKTLVVSPHHSRTQQVNIIEGHDLFSVVASGFIRLVPS